LLFDYFYSNEIDIENRACHRSSFIFIILYRGRLNKEICLYV